MTTTASAEALQALEAYRRAEREAYNASDLALVENFSEDIILSSNGVRTLRGRAAVREFFREVWTHNTARFLEVVDEDIVEFGGFLSVSGYFALELTPKNGGPPIVDRGRYQGVFVRSSDGAYRLWREACLDAGPTTGER